MSCAAPLNHPHPHLIHLSNRGSPVVSGQLLSHGKYGIAVCGTIRGETGHYLGYWIDMSIDRYAGGQAVA